MAPSKSGEFRVVADVPGTVSVSGSLNFATAENALAAMRNAFAKGSCHTLDLSEVTTCDSAGLACVLAALSAAEQDGRHITVRSVPTGMQALARVSGVESFLH
jgi:phospholipid transport system transporter-binding protein